MRSSYEHDTTDGRYRSYPPLRVFLPSNQWTKRGFRISYIPLSFVTPELPAPPLLYLPLRMDDTRLAIMLMNTHTHTHTLSLSLSLSLHRLCLGTPTADTPGPASATFAPMPYSNSQPHAQQYRDYGGPPPYDNQAWSFSTTSTSSSSVHSNSLSLRSSILNPYDNQGGGGGSYYPGP
jgi:hypothetical protein